MTFISACVGIIIGVLFTSYLHERLDEYAENKVMTEATFRERFCLEAVRAKIVEKCYTQSLSVNPESK